MSKLKVGDVAVVINSEEHWDHEDDQKESFAQLCVISGSEDEDGDIIVRHDMDGEQMGLWYYSESCLEKIGTL